MNVTLENGLNSSIPFIPSEDNSLRIAIFSFNLILWLPTHSYVLWLILSGAGGTIASELFSLNLTVSGIISSLVSVFYFAWIFTHDIVFNVILIMVGVLILYSFPSLQCCICVERYIAVVHPVIYLRYKSLRYRVACCCVVWLMVLALIFAYVLDGLSTTVSSYTFLSFYIVFISVMSFCCLSVLRALKQPGPGEGQRDSREGKDMKRRAFKTILIILIAMLLSYIPYVITVALQLFLNSGTFHTYVEITYSIVMMLGLVHPVLYMHRVGKLPCFKML